ncbi:hypothetical protein HU200_018841 [Digitaria exilis]|uniref:Lecithin-cholesterol acyltransferase-like 1 n=1 Tax=Digitaria exilis TaxID=1010633 RepID=A0A835KGW8_9POAL|nr:hypothetical protein HU200_018841 [Digitaria exilis]
MAARFRWAALLLVPAVSVILSKYSRSSTPGLLPPVVLVPGYATNELDARLTELYRPSPPRCATRKGQGWFRLYLDHASLNDPTGVRCFAEQMSSVYDAASRSSGPPRVGYRDGETLFGAPYDFRYAVPSIAGDAFFAGLKRLVEKASRLNGGTPVTVVAHSYGATLAYQFLLRRPLPWRRRFVRRFVPVAAPWGGVVLGMFTLVAGNSLGLPFVDPVALKGEYRSLQSSLWALPSPGVFGAAQPLVTTRSRSYTARDMVGFLEAIGMGEAVGPYETRVLPLFRGLGWARRRCWLTPLHGR